MRNTGLDETQAGIKKIRATKGTVHEKVSTIRHRNGMDLTEA